MVDKKDDLAEKYISEVTKTLQEAKKEVKVISKPIFFDKRQYSVRIPKKFAEALAINPKKDTFNFEIHTLQKDGKIIQELRGVLVHGS